MDHYSTRSITGTIKLSNERDRSNRHVAPFGTNLVKKCWQVVRRFRRISPARKSS